jgi:O-antigen/teichoic acid export membrane protein
LVSVGAFLITRFSTFAVGYFLGLAVAGQYAIAMQAFGVIQALSQIAFSLNMPKIAAARIDADRARLRHLVVRSLGFAWAFFVVASAGLMIIGPTLLLIIHSRTHLPTVGVLALMSAVWFLESNHTNCATVIVTANTVPFVPAALVSGVAVAVGVTAAGLLGGGLLSFVLIQGVVQAAYNNWKWPLLVYQELSERHTAYMYT